MNLLEDRLQHANSAVVLATINLFLHLTISMADVHQQVTFDSILMPISSMFLLQYKKSYGNPINSIDIPVLVLLACSCNELQRGGVHIL
jgi:hypothetical protein